MPLNSTIMQDHKYEVGDTVYEITRPQQLMLITKRNGSVYYCRPTENKNKEIAFMERDLKKEEHSLEPGNTK